MNDLRGLLFLMLLGLPLIATVNFECRTHFKCLDETHFHICVDFGDGILRTIDTVVFPCPPQMICDETNKNECHLPIITTTTQMSTLAAVNGNTSSIFPDTSTLATTSSFENDSILLNRNTQNATTLGAVSTDTSTQAIVLQSTQTYNHTKIQDLVNTTDTSTTTEIYLGDANANDNQAQEDLNQTVYANNHFASTKVYDNVYRNDSNLTEDLKYIDISSTTAEPNIISDKTQDIISEPKSLNNNSTDIKLHDAINSHGESNHTNGNDAIGFTTETTVSTTIYLDKYTKSNDHNKVIGTKSKFKKEDTNNNKPTEATVLTTTYISDDSDDFKNKVYMRTTDENKEIDITYVTTDILVERNTLRPSDVASSNKLDYLTDFNKTKNIENKLNDERNDTDVINLTFDPPIETTTNAYFLTFENKKDSVNFDKHSEKSQSINNSDTIFDRTEKNKTEHKLGYPLNSTKQGHKPFTSIGKTNGVRYTTTDTPIETTMLMNSYFFDYNKNEMKITDKGTTDKTKEITVIPDLKDAVDAISLLLLNTTDSMDESKSNHNVIDDPHIMTEVPNKEILIKSGNRVNESKISMLKENQQIDTTNINPSNATYLMTTNDHGHGQKIDVTNMLTATASVPISNVDLKLNDTAITTEAITIDKISTAEEAFLTSLIENKTPSSNISSNATDTISVMLLNTNNSMDKSKLKHNSFDNSHIRTEEPTNANVFDNSLEIFDFIKSENRVNESKLITIKNNQQKDKNNTIYTSNSTNIMNSNFLKSTNDKGHPHATDTNAKNDVPNMSTDTMSFSTNNVDFIQLHDTAITTDTIFIDEKTSASKNAVLTLLIENTTQRSNILSNATNTISVSLPNTNISRDKSKFKQNLLDDPDTRTEEPAKAFNNTLEIFDFVKSENRKNGSTLSTIKENQQKDKTNIIYTSNSTDTKNSYLFKFTNDTQTTDATSVKIDVLMTTDTVSSNNVDFTQLRDTVKTTDTITTEETTTAENAFLSSHVDTLIVYTTQRSNISSNTTDSVPSKLFVVTNSSSQSHTSKKSSTTDEPNATEVTVSLYNLNISKSDNSSSAINMSTTKENTVLVKAFQNSKVDERTEKLYTTQQLYTNSLNNNLVSTKGTSVTEQSRSEDDMSIVTTSTEYNGLHNLITKAIVKNINSTQIHDIYIKSNIINTNNESLTDVSTISYGSKEKHLADVHLSTGTKLQHIPAEVKIKVSNYSVQTEASTNAINSYGINNNMYENSSHVKETDWIFLDGHLDVLTTATDLHESTTIQNKMLITTTTETTSISSIQLNDVINEIKENFTNIVPITSTEKHYIPVGFEPDRAGSSTTAKLQDPSDNVVFLTEKTLVKDNITNINRTSLDSLMNLYTRVPKTNEKSLQTDLEDIAVIPTTMNTKTENYNTFNSISPIDEKQHKEIIIYIDETNKDIFSKASTGVQEQTTVSQPGPRQTTETITINTALEKNVYETTTRTDSHNYIISKNERMTEGYPKSPINVEIKKILNDMNSTRFPTEKTAFEPRQQLNSTTVIDFVNKIDAKNGKNITSIKNNNVGNASDSTNKTSSPMEKTTDIINITLVPLSIDPQFLLPSIKTTSFHENREDNINSTYGKLDLPTKIDIGHSENNTTISIQTSTTKPIEVNVTTAILNPLNITNHTENDTSYDSHLNDKLLASHAYGYKQPILKQEKDKTDVNHNISDSIRIIDKSGDNQTLKINTLDLQNSFIEHESKQYITEEGYKKHIDQPVKENVHNIIPKIQANIVEPSSNGIITTTEGSSNKTNIIAKLTTEKHMNFTREVGGNTSSDGIDITEASIIELHDDVNVSGKSKPLQDTSNETTKSLGSHLPKPDSFVRNISDIAETETKKPQPLKSITEFECVTEGRFSDTITTNYYYICVINGDSFVRFKFGCQKGYHVNKLSVKCQQNEEATVQYTASTKPSKETNTAINVPSHPTSKNSTAEIESVDNDIKETGNLEIVEITEANNVLTMIRDSEVVINTQSEEETEVDEEQNSTINPNKSIQPKSENIEPTTARLKQEELANVEIFANNLNAKTKHDMPIILLNIDTLQLSTIPTTPQGIITEPIGNLHEQKVEGAQSDHITVTNISPKYIITSTTEAVKPISTYKSTTVPSTGNTLAKPATSTVPNGTNFVCPDKTYTKYADHHDCRKVYVCAGKIHPIITECPTGSVFSDLKKQCTKNLSHCIRNNEFQCPSEGRFHDILSNIYYYICVKNSNHFIRYKLRCKKGYHVNESTLKCELNKESIEQSSISQSSIESSEKSAASIKKEHKRSTERQRSNRKEGSSFKCVKEGKFPDPNNCRKYYVCSKKDGRNRKKRKRCKRNQVFNKEKLRCIKAESHKCE